MASNVITSHRPIVAGRAAAQSPAQHKVQPRRACIENRPRSL